MTAKLFERMQVRMGTPARASAPSPLLTYIAGEFAGAIAAVWRAPHAEFFALPAARRHAAAIVLAGAAPGAPEDAGLRRLVEFRRDADVGTALAGEHAQGLMRMLAKAGEVLWKPHSYVTLMELVRDASAAEVLRHLDEVRPLAFEPMAALPQALRIAPIVAVMPSVEAAMDVALAYSLAVRMRGGEHAGRIARRWGAGGDKRQLFERARDDLAPDAFGRWIPPPDLGEGFVRISNRKALERAALEYRNCLGDHVQRIAEGRMAVFEWAVEPRVILALNQDVAGWRLAEAKHVDNVPVPELLSLRLVQALEARDVRTGPSVTGLIQRLEDHGNGTDYVHRPGTMWYPRLSLGDLWT